MKSHGMLVVISYMEKSKAEEANRECQEEDLILTKEIKEGVMEKVAWVKVMKEVREKSRWKSGDRYFQSEKTHTKNLM